MKLLCSKASSSPISLDPTAIKIKVESVRKHVVTKRVTHVEIAVADGSKSVSVKILAIRTHTRMQKCILASELSANILK